MRICGKGSRTKVKWSLQEGEGSGGVTNTGNGAATARDSAGNGPTTEVKSTAGGGANGGSTTKGGAMGTSNIAQAANTGSKIATESGSKSTEGNRGNSPAKTSGGTGNGIVNGSATEARSTSTITTTSSPGASLTGPGTMSSETVAAIVVGSVLALLLLVAIALFALGYRQRRMAEKKGSVQINVHSTNYHSHYWWLAPFMAASNRRQPRDGATGVLARAGPMRWSSFRGKERKSKTYHELEGQKDSHDRKNANEFQERWAERPMTYEIEASITKPRRL